jgi:hypothetical protein
VSALRRLRRRVCALLRRWWRDAAQRLREVAGGTTRRRCSARAAGKLDRATAGHDRSRWTRGPRSRPTGDDEELAKVQAFAYEQLDFHQARIAGIDINRVRRSKLVPRANGTAGARREFGCGAARFLPTG